MAKRKTYGGFFPLEIPQVFHEGNTRIEHLDNALTFYNARSAIATLISANNIKDVVIPNYICPVVNQAVEYAGAKIRYCSVNPDFTFSYAELAAMARDETLLVIPSYFGVYMPDINALTSIRSQTGCRILLDYAQALYEPSPKGFSAVYSPRKFLGVPDGGFLVEGGESGLKPPAQSKARIDQSLFGERLACSGIRREYPDENNFEPFRNLEKTMPCGSISMSNLSIDVFSAFDHENACKKRSRNYETLSMSFEQPAVRDLSLPLCFPKLIKPEEFDTVRQQLIDKGVFVPYYWPGSNNEMMLGRSVLPLPIDHRFGGEDMTMMATLVKQVLR